MNDIKKRGMDIIRELNSIHFFRINIEEVGNSLGTVVLYNSENEVTLKRAIGDVLFVLIKESITVEAEGLSDKVFCFTTSYIHRKDHYADIRRVYETAKGRMFISGAVKSGFRPRRFIWGLNILIWLIQMSELKIKFSYKLLLCAQILRGYTFVKEVERKLKQREILPKLVVTFCDVHVADYFITDYFNKKNIPTATLQHAVYSHITSAYSNAFSNSRYFLGISEYGKQEFIKSGADETKYVVLGSMKYIDEIINNNFVVKNEKIIGVLLSGNAFMDENNKLLEFAGKLSKEFGLWIKVRCHPTLNIDMFNSNINYSCMEVDHSESLKEFADKCDFCIMGSTNSFGELITYGHLGYRMVMDTDNFDGINEFRFCNYFELQSLFNRTIREIDSVKKDFYKVKKFVCAKGDIKRNYQKFFEQF